MPAPASGLADPETGLVVEPGLLTAVVSAEPDESAALADRLGRFGSSDGVELGGVPLTALPLSAVRDRVVVSETEPRLFTGVMRDELSSAAGREVSDEELWAAIEVANAADAVDATPDGLDGLIEERGRSLSGGQRQRLALARALLRDPDTLVLVEPTSAVDAHTEARIGARLRQARTGRSTVVMTSSPLMLDNADRVVFLADGVVRATGTHEELLETSPGYRAVVLRGEEE
jgi:ABC-type bacteriocin/lantibiotic exporter with double-glycine peptidase domain